jgi:hypothetical protein
MLKQQKYQGRNTEETSNPPGIEDDLADQQYSGT